jgi:hypothetical protein
LSARALLWDLKIRKSNTITGVKQNCQNDRLLDYVIKLQSSSHFYAPTFNMEQIDDLQRIEGEGIKSASIPFSFFGWILLDQAPRCMKPYETIVAVITKRFCKNIRSSEFQSKTFGSTGAVPRCCHSSPRHRRLGFLSTPWN